MFIANDAISDWKDLQNKVAQLFAELGFDVKTPCVVELAGRGKKEVDVFAEDRRASSTTVHIFECKWWNTEVPQDTVHAFQTVVSGCGANTGFIISKVGFQKGAKEAAQFSNMNLLTFEELQHKFGPEWFRIQQSKISELRGKLTEVHRLHFDQFNTLPIANNMVFHTAALSERLSRLHKWGMQLLMLSNSRWPESYKGPEPVKMTSDPTDPDRELPNEIFWHETQTVREFFQKLIRGLETWGAEWDALDVEARTSFEALHPEEQGRLMRETLVAAREELPLRVLKGKIPSEEFERLINLV